jgi:hypothetical protein
MNLRQLGARVRLYDEDGGDLGFAHAPRPVLKGDVLSLADGSLFRVVVVIDLEGAPLDALCAVEPLIASRD